MARRLDGGRILIALGAVALLVSLFLDWYESGFDGSAATAWSAFELVDLLLAVLALTAIFGALSPVLPQAPAPAAPAWVLTAVGPVAFVLVALALIDRPPAAQGSEIDAGAWIALAASAAMAAGALLAVARVSLVISVRDRKPPFDQRGDPGAAPPGERVSEEDETQPLPPTR